MPETKYITGDAINLELGVMDIIEEIVLSHMEEFNRRTSKIKAAEEGDILLYIGHQLIAIGKLPSVYQVRVLELPEKHDTSTVAKEFDKLEETLYLHRNLPGESYNRKQTLNRIVNLLIHDEVNVDALFRCPEISVRSQYGIRCFGSTYCNLFTPVLDLPTHTTCKLVKKVRNCEPAVIDASLRDILNPKDITELSSSLSPKLCDVYGAILADKNPNRLLGEDGYTEFLKSLRKCKLAGNKFESNVVAIIYGKDMSYALDMVTSREYLFSSAIKDVRVHIDYYSRANYTENRAKRIIGIDPKEPLRKEGRTINTENVYISRDLVPKETRELVCYPSKERAQAYINKYGIIQTTFTQAEVMMINRSKEFYKHMGKVEHESYDRKFDFYKGLGHLQPFSKVFGVGTPIPIITNANPTSVPRPFAYSPSTSLPALTQSQGMMQITPGMKTLASDMMLLSSGISRTSSTMPITTAMMDQPSTSAMIPTYQPSTSTSTNSISFREIIDSSPQQEPIQQAPQTVRIIRLLPQKQTFNDSDALNIANPSETSVQTDDLSVEDMSPEEITTFDKFIEVAGENLETEQVKGQSQEETGQSQEVKGQSQEVKGQSQEETDQSQEEPPVKLRKIE